MLEVLGRFLFSFCPKVEIRFFLRYGPVIFVYVLAEFENWNVSDIAQHRNTIVKVFPPAGLFVGQIQEKFSKNLRRDCDQENLCFHACW